MDVHVFITRVCLAITIVIHSKLGILLCVYQIDRIANLGISVVDKLNFNSTTLDIINCLSIPLSVVYLVTQSNSIAKSVIFTKFASKKTAS
jgi:hypothetical protein